jgi:hypothetical protein
MRWSDGAERSAWRWPAAAAALVTVAAHLPVTASHLREAPYIGWSFVALEVTLSVVALGLLLSDRTPVWWAAGTIPALAVLAYAVTRTVPLPQMADDVGNWTQPLGLVALTAEALLIAITLGRHTTRHSAAWLTHRPILWAGLIVVAGLVATDYATAVGGTG